jgi:hypothetical protein
MMMVRVTVVLLLQLEESRLLDARMVVAEELIDGAIEDVGIVKGEEMPYFGLVRGNATLELRAPSYASTDLDLVFVRQVTSD